MYLSLNLLGSVVLDVDDTRLDATFLDHTGQVLDHFTLKKGPDCPDQDGDRVCDADDNCPADPNADQADADSDGRGDICDLASTTLRRRRFGRHLRGPGQLPGTFNSPQSTPISMARVTAAMRTTTMTVSPTGRTALPFTRVFPGLRVP